ncbi:MAG: hypothetical protein FJW37_07485, partial [Acidobacteria bacterium]|nr:hypothetical protein [Acidobacteriota bacterium]
MPRACFGWLSLAGPRLWGRAACLAAALALWALGGGAAAGAGRDPKPPRTRQEPAPSPGGASGRLARAAHTSLRIDPQGISLPSPGASQAYIVTAADRTGLETDVTAACAVRSSDPAVVEIDRERGRIFAKAPGRARILVSFEGARAGSQVTVGNRPAELQVRFSPDVVSVLTIKGCNGSGCHGSPAGQSGFKLSLFGYNVEADHEMIVKQQGGRRIDVARPGESLLLKKPAFQIPHGGGRVLPPDSEEYETLLSWLKQGARLDSGGVRLNRLEMYPGERILTAGARQRLVVIGRLSDGTTRDMSRSVRYSTGDEAVAGVSADGTVAAGRRGLTAVLARAMGQVAATQIGVIPARSAGLAAGEGSLPEPDPEPNNVIDELVFAKQRRLSVAAFPLSSDREFARRVFLDVVGRLPEPGELREFLSGPGAGRRPR